MVVICVDLQHFDHCASTYARFWKDIILQMLSLSHFSYNLPFGPISATAVNIVPYIQKD